MLKRLFKHKRLLIAILFVAATAGYFWSQSRIPQLNEKALMGGDSDIDAIGFDVVLAVRADDPAWKRIAYTTVNWLKTNQKGMMFGVVFAAGMMVMFSLMKKRSFKSGFANSVLGMAIGAPLGVCVNCAAPIAQGMHSGGARVETTLAAMIASPTLNMIVLTILVSLFPAYLVGMKLGLTFLFILVCIPLMARYMSASVKSPEQDKACPTDLNVSAEAPPGEGWLGAGAWFVKAFAKNLWYIVKITVPLMFLAGFLGSVMITFMPWNVLTDILPTGSPFYVLAGMCIVAVVGVLLPVPIAFDVIVTAILLAGGMPVRYAMVLLFTLGIYSCYSFFIVWNGISRKIAVTMTVMLAGLGVVAGVAADQFHKWDLAQRRQVFFEEFGEEASPHGPTTWCVETGPRRAPQLGAAVEQVPQPGLTAEGVVVQRIEWAPRSTGESRFTRFEGREFGFDEPYPFSVMHYLTYSRYRGIATGDVHGDGWADVLLTSERGFSLYANEQGRGFVRQDVDVPGLESMFVVNAALVDLDDDGWLDIVFSAHDSGVKFLKNREGEFGGEPEPIPNTDGAVMSATMAFGDIEPDGDLDIFLGNWSIGTMGQIRGVEGWVASNKNALLVNGGGRFDVRELPGFLAETLSSAFTDLDGDGVLDLMVGNDFEPPDDFYLGDGAGGFRRLWLSDGIIPHSSRSTMTMTTADVNNDLRPEIFIAGITGRLVGQNLDLVEVSPELASELQDPAYHAHVERIYRLHAKMLKAVRTRDISICLTVEPEVVEDAIAVLLFNSASRWTRSTEMCDMFPESWHRFETSCRRTFGERVTLPPEEMVDAIDHEGKGLNVLLFRGDDGKFVDRTVEWGVDVSGWAWNSKFADLNNDEWQDVFVANGDFITGFREKNMLFENRGGKRFEEVAADFGMDSRLAASSYSYVDFDNDGDLDILLVPQIGPVLVYRNELDDCNAIQFVLRDEQGNRFGIGSTVTIHYGTNGKRHQMHEIHSGGGFISFDAPVVHFGLGEHAEVSRVEVRWSTGEQTELAGPFLAGGRYVLTRRAANR